MLSFIIKKGISQTHSVHRFNILIHSNTWSLFKWIAKKFKFCKTHMTFFLSWNSNRDIVHQFKGIVHPKMKILSSFTHPVFPNLYECLCSAEHKGRYSEECGKQSCSGAPLTSKVFFSYYGSQWCPGYKLSSRYLPLCLAEQRNSYRFGTTWGWVINDSNFIFGWTIPLSLCFY